MGLLGPPRRKIHTTTLPQSELDISLLFGLPLVNHYLLASQGGSIQPDKKRCDRWENSPRCLPQRWKGLKCSGRSWIKHQTWMLGGDGEAAHLELVLYSPVQASLPVDLAPEDLQEAVVPCSTPTLPCVVLGIPCQRLLTLEQPCAGKILGRGIMLREWKNLLYISSDNRCCGDLVARSALSKEILWQEIPCAGMASRQQQGGWSSF